MVTFELSGEVKEIMAAPLTWNLMQNVSAVDTELQSTPIMEQHLIRFLQLSPFNREYLLHDLYLYQLRNFLRK